MGLLSEMPPEGKVGVSAMCVLGYNVNNGQEISLRLRTDDLKVSILVSCFSVDGAQLALPCPTNLSYGVPPAHLSFLHCLLEQGLY